MSRLASLSCLLPLLLGIGLYPFWNVSSSKDLEIAEAEVLKVITSSTEKKLVPVGDAKYISTLIFKPPHQPHSTHPVVMVHGFGGASLFFFKNIDALSKDRVVITLDLPGFGLSSRFNFTSNADEAERQFVDIMETWRVQMELDRFILVGHSFGAYLITCYALKYPSHIHHLVLLDPWGFAEGPSPETADEVVGTFPPGIRFQLQPTRCLASTLCHISGPVAPLYLFAWSKRPLVKRIGLLHDPIGITMITGATSWLNNSLTGQWIQQQRPESHFAAHEIVDAGHHVYAERSEEFNTLMTSVCAGVDA
eukprot:Em0021g782a